jgi:hypothetical protein
MSTLNPAHPLSPRSRRARRQATAAERQQARAERGDAAQLLMLHQMGYGTSKEAKRLKEKMEDGNG